MNENKYLVNQNQTMGENSFMKTLLKKRLNQKGLTLIELLAVIVILAIVAAIAVPAIGNVIENSRYKAVKADAVNVINAANLYYTENPSETAAVKVSDLTSKKFLDSAGKIPAGATVSVNSPRGLTTTDITYSGDKKVKFTSATVDMINANTEQTTEIK